MKEYKTIEVTFKNGHSAVWEAEKGEWDDYTYEGPVFAIKKNGAWVGICGELGADLTLTRTFLEMGVDELSVSPSFILPVRNEVCGI